MVSYNFKLCYLLLLIVCPMQSFRHTKRPPNCPQHIEDSTRPFNAKDDAIRITSRHANKEDFEGCPSDHFIICARSAAQRNTISRNHKRIPQILERKRLLYLMIQQDILHIDVVAIQKAQNVDVTQEDEFMFYNYLLTIRVGHKLQEIIDLWQKFASNDGRTLKEHIKRRTASDSAYSKLLQRLLAKEKEPSMCLNENKADEAVKKLIDGMEKKTFGNLITNTIIRNNHNQLGLILKLFKEKTGTDFNDMLPKAGIYNGNSGELLKTIVLRAEYGATQYFVKMLKKALNEGRDWFIPVPIDFEIQPNFLTIEHIFVTHTEIDLPEISAKFRKEFDKDLIEFVKERMKSGLEYAFNNLNICIDKLFSAKL